nr:sigma-70 family RNA polymerase sigma factor [uncultured Sediminibacterium sp.]
MKSFQSYDDRMLISLLEEDEEGALTELYSRYWKQLYNAVFARLKNQEQAQDIVQDVFADLWQRRGQVKIENIGGYLQTACKFQVYKIVSRKKAGPAFFELFETLGGGSYEAEEKIRQKDLLWLFAKWIDTLPEKRRNIFKLHYVEGLSSQEIAEKLHLSPKTVRNQLGTSLESFRSELSRFLNLLVF